MPEGRREPLCGRIWPVGPYLVDVALPGRELLLQKNRQVDLADEADALRILAPGRSQVLLFGDAPHFGLGKPPTGKSARDSCSCDNWQRK